MAILTDCPRSVGIRRRYRQARVSPASCQSAPRRWAARASPGTANVLGLGPFGALMAALAGSASLRSALFERASRAQGVRRRSSLVMKPCRRKIPFLGPPVVPSGTMFPKKNTSPVSFFEAHRTRTRGTLFLGRPARKTRKLHSRARCARLARFKGFGCRPPGALGSSEGWGGGN